MTTGIKKTVTNIKRQQSPLGEFELFFNVYYDVAADHVFAAGWRDADYAARIIKDAESFEPTPMCDSVDEYIGWHYSCDLDDAKKLAKRLETSIVLFREIDSEWRDGIPGMWNIEQALLRKGADIMRESYLAGVPFEYIVA